MEAANQINGQEEAWMQAVSEKYPTLLSGTNFFPPLHFNKVSWKVHEFAGEKVVVFEPQTEKQKPASPIPAVAERVAGQVFTPHHRQLRRSARSQDSDALDDKAQNRVLQYLRHLTDRMGPADNPGDSQEAMMVVSQLEYKRYLCREPKPSPLPCSTEEGEWDVIVIHRRYGVVFGEIKSVGRANKYFIDHPEEQDIMVVKQLKKALDQLNKQDTELNHLVSDLGVRVVKTLFFPFLTSDQLIKAVRSDPLISERLVQCMNPGEDSQAAVRRCMCWDDWDVPLNGVQSAPVEDSRSAAGTLQESRWWRDAIMRFEEDRNMSDEVFKRLVGRFCGPATEVDIYTVSSPSCHKVLRSAGEGVAETGLIMSRLSLYPEQFYLLSDPTMDSVYFCGPPGTGKTILLMLKALQMLRQGEEIDILCTSPDSLAVTTLIENQLKLAEPTDNVHRHVHDLTRSENVATAVGELGEKISQRVRHGGRLFLLVDEITYHVRPYIGDFLNKMHGLLKGQLTVWASGVYSTPGVSLPPWVEVKEVHIPLRCPPVIHNQVKLSRRIGGEGNLIPSYGEPPTTVSTDGPAYIPLTHSRGQEGHGDVDPEDCEQCGQQIATELNRLHVNFQAPGNLEWRDVFILSDQLRADSTLILGLKNCNIPVTFVPPNATKMIDKPALATENTVILTNIQTVSGLERRVVVGMGNSGFSRCCAISRCTSQLIWIGNPADV